MLRRMKPSALAKPLTASAAWALPPKCEKKTRPCRRSSLILTEVSVTPRRRGSRRSCRSINDSSRSTISATRSGRLPSPAAMFRILSPIAKWIKPAPSAASPILQQGSSAERRSVADDLELFAAQRCERQRLDKVHDLAQSRIDEGAIVAYLTDTNFCP